MAECLIVSFFSAFGVWCQNPISNECAVVLACDVCVCFWLLFCVWRGCVYVYAWVCVLFSWCVFYFLGVCFSSIHMLLCVDLYLTVCVSSASMLVCLHLNVRVFP